MNFVSVSDKIVLSALKNIKFEELVLPTMMEKI